MSAPAHQIRQRPHFRFRPTTLLGIRAVRLVVVGPLVSWSFAAALVATGDHLSFAVAPYFVLGGVLAILVGGAMAFMAIIRRGDRSVAAIATIPFWAVALMVFVGELLQLFVWLLTGHASA